MGSAWCRVGGSHQMAGVGLMLNERHAQGVDFRHAALTSQCPAPHTTPTPVHTPAPLTPVHTPPITLGAHPAHLSSCTLWNRSPSCSSIHASQLPRATSLTLNRVPLPAWSAAPGGREGAEGQVG